MGTGGIRAGAGRPRKLKADGTPANPKRDPDAPKRPPGRPRKHPPPDPNAPKRPPGRPRKTAAPTGPTPEQVAPFAAPLPAAPPQAFTVPAVEGESPLDFLLRVMREEKVNLDSRMRAAHIAVPFTAAKPAGNKPPTKAEERAAELEDAKQNSAFQAGRPPLRAVGGTS